LVGCTCQRKKKKGAAVGADFTEKEAFGDEIDWFRSAFIVINKHVLQEDLSSMGALLFFAGVLGEARRAASMLRKLRGRNQPLQLANFEERVTTYDLAHIWHGKVRWTYYTRDKPPVGAGYIQFTPHTGNVGLFYVFEGFKQRGLGKQILANAVFAIAHAQKKRPASQRVQSVWASTTVNHPFWGSVWGGVFAQACPIDASTSSAGFRADIPTLLRVSAVDYDRARNCAPKDVCNS
jgi:GNAT superfamily N-acetyltransferase